jgi:DNA-binding protein H-NS
VPASEAPVAEAFAPAAFEPEMPVAEETANVVDQFAQKLQILQREKTTELEQQRGRVDRIEGRMQSLESAILELAKREPPASAAKSEGTEWARPLEDLLERMLRSEGALEAWKAQHEAWSRERLALLESLRELAAGMAKGMLRNPEAEAAATSLRARAEELARDAAKLQASITKREMEAPRPTVAPKAGDARAAPPAPVEPAPQAPPAQPFESAVPEPAAAASAEAEPPPMPVDQAPSLVDPAGALELPAGEGTQVGQLMRSLEIAKSDAEKYRRKLHEQGLQFSAAYAMLDRIRPFVQALESEFAAQARGGEKKS